MTIEELAEKIQALQWEDGGNLLLLPLLKEFAEGVRAEERARYEDVVKIHEDCLPIIRRLEGVR